MTSLSTVTETGSSGFIEHGGKVYVLEGANPASFPAANKRVEGRAAPGFDGDVAVFVAAGNDSSQLYNTVKACGGCKKVCAVSMTACNGCGVSLEGVPETQTNNVFMGFVHGISKGPFPFKVRRTPPLSRE